MEMRLHAKKSEPLVTVITTVHNSARFVERCVDSVLAQTYQNWQQVIVDDGSTDQTGELIGRYRDSRISYIRLPHRGIRALAESYNIGLAKSNGSLVAVLEGDDFWPKNKLARQVPAFSDPAIQLAWGNAVIVDIDDRSIRWWPRGRFTDFENRLEVLFRELTCANILTPTVTVMARRSALDAIGGFQQPAGALFIDLPTWLKIAAHVEGKARRLNELLGYYRVHPQQISTMHYDSYHTCQAAVVSAIVSECAPPTLARLGWTERAQRRSRARSELSRGVALLKRGHRKDARRALATALGQPDSLRDAARAALGVLATFVRVDLVGAADTARRSFDSLRLRFSRQPATQTVRAVESSTIAGHHGARLDHAPPAGGRPTQV